MSMPLIGILPLYDSEKESYWMLPGYMKAVEQAGGIPVMLPLTGEEQALAALARSLDGFLFTGGHDVDPALYGEEIAEACGELCRERDRMEAQLFRLALELDKPAFGICRGLQLFNVLLGGTLHQDLPSAAGFDSAIGHKQRPLTTTRPIRCRSSPARSCASWSGPTACMSTAIIIKGSKRSLRPSPRRPRRTTA